MTGAILEIADELALRDLNARYIDAVNRLDAAAWEANWAESGVWSLMGNEMQGRTAILATWKAAMRQFELVMMTLSTGTLRRQGDAVTGRWYITEFLRPKNGVGRIVLGTYRDEYGRESGEWRFARRDYHVIYQGAFDLSGTHQPIPS